MTLEDKLNILKKRLCIKSDDEDDLLQGLLFSSENFILAYTNRDMEKWLNIFDNIQIDISVIEYNKMGLEGVNSRTEGEISTNFYNDEAYPKRITSSLNFYRLARVI